MEGPVVPKQLNYNDVLPVAIESRSNKRTFEPTNGTTFSPDGNRIIRLNINSDNLCDFTHSYLQFTVTNNTTVTAPAASARPTALTDAKLNDSAALHPDFGMPFIRRLQILSGGQELEDIDEYGRLYSMLLATQGNPEQVNELSMNQGMLDWSNAYAGKSGDGGNPLMSAQDVVLANDANGTVISAKVSELMTDMSLIQDNSVDYSNSQNPYLHNGRSFYEKADDQTAGLTTHGRFGSPDPSTANAIYSTAHAVGSGAGGAGVGADNRSAVTENGELDLQRTSYTYNIPLVSAILNNSKYWPLIFTNLGLDIYIHLEDAINVGAYRRHLGVLDLKPKYEITNVRYHAHLVDVDRSFYDRMRMAMQASGGVLQMSGTTYKHYMDTKPETTTNHIVQISTRLKSLNALLVRPQRQELNNRQQHFCVSVGEGCFMNEFAFRIGSIQYPQRGVAITDTNIGESYSELKKTFGVLGDYTHNNFVNRTTYKRGVSENLPGTPYSFFTASYGFEGFAKTAAESGINVSDRALPVVCEIKRQEFGNAATNSQSGVPKTVFNDNKQLQADDSEWTGTTDAHKELVAKYDADTCANIRYDVFAVTDMIIYITADGSVSTRI